MTQSFRSLSARLATGCAVAAFVTMAGAENSPLRAAELWTAQSCGAEPDAPTVETSSVDRYNASVDKVTTYEKAARAYNACVAHEANKQETDISNDARDKIQHVHDGSVAVQKRIAANFTSITAALKAGGAKFAAH